MLTTWLLSASALLAAQTAAEPQSAVSCPLSRPSHEWMQRAVGGWSIIKADLLKLGDQPLPWMIFYDGTCAWHVSADPKLIGGGRRLKEQLRYGDAAVPIVAVAHGGQIKVPDGKTIPAQPMAYTGAYSDNERSFFVVALPDLWRPQWKPTDPKLEEFFLGVTAHELTHTTQITEIARRLQSLRNAPGFPQHVSDDVVEETFKKDPVYRSEFERERDLFFDAAAEPNDERARALAREALGLLEQRHSRYFIGDKQVFRNFEDLFLNMEGVAGWVQHRMAQRDPANFTFEESIHKTKGRSTAWVQGQGLAMVLLIDRFVPNWQKRMLAPELASPIALLREALDAPSLTAATK